MLRTVDQKCQSEVRIKSVAQKCEVSLRSVDGQCGSEVLVSSVAQMCNSEV